MKTRRLGVKAALLDGTVVPGDVEVSDGLITAVGTTPAGKEGTAVPGFVDLQVNGFAGVDFLGSDPDGFVHAGEALAACGVTAYQPTLVSAPPSAVLSALETISKVRNGTAAQVLGVHLEGPFLSPAWKGAHDEGHIVPPDLDLAGRLCDGGPVTYMTMAPEQPGGFELLDYLVRRGIVVALGHTDADAAMAHTAFDRGARAVTHLHNAQRRMTSRDPGVAGVALTRSDVVVQAIVDLVHLAPETVLMAWMCAKSRFALVTDAIGAASTPESEHTLGERTIKVTDAGRLPDGTLAGSVLTMDAAVRNLASLGVPWPDAVRAATSVPSNLVGRPELGSLQPQTPADITVLDDGLFPRRTLIGGREAWVRQ